MKALKQCINEAQYIGLIVVTKNDVEMFRKSSDPIQFKMFEKDKYLKQYVKDDYVVFPKNTFIRLSSGNYTINDYDFDVLFPDGTLVPHLPSYDMWSFKYIWKAIQKQCQTTNADIDALAKTTYEV